MSGHDNYYGLFEAFIDGATNDSYKKCDIVDDGDRTLLVGYKHSVYAERDKETGAITVFTGWADRATKASELHVNKFRRALSQFRDWNDAVDLDSMEDRLPTLQNGDLASFEVDMAPVGSDEPEAEPEPEADEGPTAEADDSGGLGELFATGDD